MRAINRSLTTTDSDETLDALFDGKLQLLQSRSGYRFSLDALLLADFVTVKRHERLVDLGTGSGVIPLVLARRHPGLTMLGIECQPSLVQRARRNVSENGFADSVEIVRGDVREIGQTAERGSFDVAVCNPPYRPVGSGRNSPNDERRIARHEVHGGLGDFLSAAEYLLRSKGRVAVIYLAARAVELCVGLRAARLEPKRVRLVHSFVDADASLVLVEAVKLGRGGLQVLPPLIVFRAGKEYSEEAAAIISGTGSREPRAKP